MERRSTIADNGVTGTVRIANRRVDWRFLLPKLEWHRIGYCGYRDEGLISELLAVAQSTISIVDLDAPLVDGPFFDLIVLLAPSVRDLARAAQLLAEGGWLYIEASGLWNLMYDRSDLERCFRGILLSPSKLRRHGFNNVECYWCRPHVVDSTGERSRQFVPLLDRKALCYALRGQRRTLVGRTILAALQIAADLRVLRCLVRTFNIIAQKNDACCGCIRKMANGSE